MSIIRKAIITIFLSIYILSQSCFSQELAQAPRVMPLTRILFIFDGSMSMIGLWEQKAKIEVARSILIPFLDSISKIPNVEIALRVYGNRSPFPPQDCGDTHLEVPFGPNNVPSIIRTILELTPNGTTPIAYSLEQSVNDFPKDSTARNIIFIITDGIEACDGDPCAVSRELQKKGVILKPFIIGVGNEVDWDKVFNCAGNVYSAKSEIEFLPILNMAMEKALITTPLQVYLLDAYKKPRETDVPMTFYDNANGFIRYNFVHSVIKPCEPDIMFLDPLVSYRLKIHTMPPVFYDSINLEPGKHTIIKVDVPQGFLMIEKPFGTTVYGNLQGIVRIANDMNTLNVQTVNFKQKYICGKYDLEIFTLPRTYFYGVEVKQNELTTLKIPSPGRISFTRPQFGFGSIFIDRNTDLEFVAKLDEVGKGNDSFTLQPGKYVVIWRDKSFTDTEKSIYKNFEITSGCSKFIQLNK
jgi:Ca-activated chloride channel family protein